MSDFPALDALTEGNKKKKATGKGEERGFFSEIAVQTVGGMRDALTEMTELYLDHVDMGPINDFYRPPAEIPEPQTVTGGLVRGGTQFASGFVPAFKLMSAGQTSAKVAQFAQRLGLTPKMAQAMGLVAQSEIAAQVADQVAFDPRGHRLSNIIQEVPALANPVTAYLASNPNDSEAEARFKVALEGAGLGLMVAPIIPVFRRMRANRVTSNLDKAFEDAKRAEAANIRKETQRVAEQVKPEQIVAETPQGSRPYINNEYLDTPDAIKNTINSVGNVFAKTIDDARRGTMATAQTEKLARNMGMSVADLTARRKGQAFNAEEAFASRLLLTRSADNLTQLAQLATDPATNSETVQFAFQKALARHAAIQEQVMGIAAEAGRALRQFQIPADVPNKADAIKQLLKEQSLRGVDPQRLADMVARLDTPEGLAGFARAAHAPKLRDKVTELWINFLLSGPTTQAVNVTSNALTAVLTVPENFVAATLGAVKRADDRVFFRELPSRAFGLIQGARDGLKSAYKTFLTEEPSDLLTKVETDKGQAIPSLVFREGAERKSFKGWEVPFTGEIQLGGRQVRIPGRLLQAGDEFFKAIGYRMELNARAMRDGLQQNLKGRELAEHVKGIVNDPPAKIHEAAIANARYQTFTQELGRTGRDFQAMVARHPGLRIIAPFIRTPVNIVKFAGQRSPIGYWMDSVKAALDEGGAMADIARSRMLLGSSIGASMAALAMEGHITGGGPGDSRRRAAMRNAGWQPYSIRIGDNFYAYNRFEPMGMLVGVAADMAEIAEAADDDEIDDMGKMIIGSISKNLTSKTWLRGLSELVLAIEDPDRYGDNYIRQLAGTVVPTGLAQAARIEDPILRQANTIADQIRSRMPGFSQELYPKRNVWGDPIELGGALGPDIISPVYTSVINSDPVVMEVDRLEMGLSKPNRVVKGVELNDDQYDRYQRWSGGIAKRILRGYITSPAWPHIPDHKKIELIEGTMTRARSAARVRLLPEIAPQILANRRKELEE